MIGKKKLAIFDLDGTLFDTADVNFRAYEYAIKKCGFKCSFDCSYYRKYCNGNSYKVFLPEIISKISERDMEEIHKCKKQAYIDFISEARKNEHLFSIIECIKKDYLIALSTTASRKNTEDILETFNVRDFFDIIITQEDVKETKPNAECFLLAMSMANVDKSDTIIFEDSDIGIQAARSSGANYVRIYGFN